MTHAWALLPLVAVLPSVLASFPEPSAQTQEQLSLFQKTAAAAKEASDAATPKVLEFFDSDDFRGVLRDCCPDVASLPAQELLRRYRAEAQIAELAHALPAEMTKGSRFDDVTESEVGQLSWFPNEFQTALMHGTASNETSGGINDFAQQHIFGSAPFAGKTPTWPEAANRLIYIAHNMRRLDTGSLPHFGDVIVVFNTSHVKNSVVIAPYDTGLYTMTCLSPTSSGGPPGMVTLNCSAWSSRVVGTLDHLDHLIIPNLQVPYNCSKTTLTWKDAAKSIWSRAFSKTPYQDLPTISQDDMMNYLEADILANPRLPEAAKLVIGNFATLAGTADGRKLQALAANRSWPLFWALGTGSPASQLGPYTQEGETSCNHRIADPATIVSLTNASVPRGAKSAFDAMWANATQTRAARSITSKDLKSWWAAMASSQLRVAPLSAASCASADQCVAVELTSGDCVCVSDTRLLTV